MEVKRITAEEARGLIENNKVVWREKDEKQLAEIMDMIEAAINMRVYKITYCLPMSDIVYTEIVNLGYNICSTRDITHTSYDITW